MIQPALAESWEIDDTGRTYTIKLRTDVKWHNGIVSPQRMLKLPLTESENLKT